MASNVLKLGDKHGRNATIVSDSCGAVVYWAIKRTVGMSSCYPQTAEAVAAVEAWIAGGFIGG